MYVDYKIYQCNILRARF